MNELPSKDMTTQEENLISEEHERNGLTPYELETGFAGSCAAFELPNGTYGIMTGDTMDDVLRRLDVLHAFYSLYELTNETHTVVMPNGLPITDVPIGYTARDIFLLFDATISIVDQFNEFPLIQKQKSESVH